jgi:hypothetical protein
MADTFRADHQPCFDAEVIGYGVGSEKAPRHRLPGGGPAAQTPR